MRKNITILVLGLTLSLLLFNPLARGNPGDALQVSFIDIGNPNHHAED